MRAATSLDQAVSLLGLAVCPNLAAGDRITILGVSSANAIYETVFGGPAPVAKVNYAGVQDGVALYLHGFIVTGDGSGLNNRARSGSRARPARGWPAYRCAR